MTESTIEYAYTACGLPVILIGIPETNGEVTIPRVNELHNLIAGTILRSRKVLGSDEIRFIRTHLGLAPKDLTLYLGPNQVTKDGHFRGNVPDARFRGFVRKNLDVTLRDVVAALHGVHGEGTPLTKPIRIKITETGYELLEA